MCAESRSRRADSASYITKNECYEFKKSEKMLLVPFEELVMRLYQWGVGGKAYPLFCYFYMQEQSKMEDPICFDEGRQKKGEKRNFLKVDEVLAIMDEMAAAGVRDFRLIGGPNNHYGHELITDILSTVKAHGSTVSLISKGMPLSGPELRSMIAAKIDMFEFLIFGPDETTHFYNRKKDNTWANIITALSTLNDIKDMNSDYSPRICINAVLTRANWAKLPNMIKFAYRSNADGFEVHLPGPLLNRSSELSLRQNQARELLLIKDDLANLCRIYRLEDNLDLYQRERLLLPRKPKVKKRPFNPPSDGVDLSIHIARFKKRFPKMEESFIRFAILKDFQSWYIVHLGPEGIFIPSEENKGLSPSRGYCDTHDSLDGLLDNLWFGERYNKHRTEISSREIDSIYQGYPLLGQRDLKDIQKGLLKRWRDVSRLQPKKQDMQGNLLMEYWKKEAMFKIKMLDKDIQRLRENISDMERRIDLYAKDKERIMKLRQSRFFRWYQSIQREL